MKLLRVLIFAIAISVTPSFVGCAWLQPTTVAAGHDPVVVGAEQTAKLSLSYASEFLKWEWPNRAGLPKEVTALADDVRSDFPPAYGDFRAATKAYKTTRSPEHRATLLTAQAIIDTIIARVRARLPAENQKKAELAAAKINL